MRSTSFSVLAFVFTLSAGLVGCKGADGDTCKEDNDCSSGLMCCRAGSFERGTCGVTCDVVRDSGPALDSGPMSDAGPMMSDVPEEDSGAVDAAMSDTNEDMDSGPADVGVDATTDSGPEADAGPMDAGTDAGPVDAGTDAASGDAGSTDSGPDAEA